MCYRPITLKNGYSVPCGSCLECLSRHRSEWRQRMFFEAKDNNRMFFVTLTVSPRYMDYVSINGCMRMCVSKRKIQKFHKRLRRYIYYHHYRIGFRYFVVSEYGPKTLRPHYHGLYYVNGKDWRYFKEIVKKVWYFGFVDVNLCRDKGKSCSYVSNYLIINKITPYDQFRWNNNDYRIDSSRTFVLFSRSLGNSYFTRVLKTQIMRNFLTFAKGTNIISIIKHYIVNDRDLYDFFRKLKYIESK